MAIHLLELPKFLRPGESLVGERDRWLYFLRRAEMLDDEAVPAALDTPPIRKAIQELKMLTQDDLERERYEARLKLQRDAQMHAEAAKVALEHGRSEGLKKGRKEGRVEGAFIGVI